MGGGGLPLQTMIRQNFGGKRGVLWDLCKYRFVVIKIDNKQQNLRTLG